MPLALARAPRSVGPARPPRSIEAVRVPSPAGLAGVAIARPLQRGDCAGGARPCPWTSCRHHLLAEAQGRGLEDLRESCALDVADRGAARLEEIADLFGVCRARVQQIEARAMGKLAVMIAGEELDPREPRRRPRRKARRARRRGRS